MTTPITNTDPTPTPPAPPNLGALPISSAFISPSPDSPLLAPSILPSSILLEGFRRFVQFLLEEEADYLCGVSLYTHSSERTNYRTGYRPPRMLRTPLGPILVRVSNIKYMVLRVSIAKRAKRLAPATFEILARIHAAGAAPADVSTLIKILWTIELPDELLAHLSEKLAPILEAWRNGQEAQPLVRRKKGRQPKPKNHNTARIKKLRMSEFSDDFLAALADKLAPFLEQQRAQKTAQHATTQPEPQNPSSVP